MSCDTTRGVIAGIAAAVVAVSIVAAAKPTFAYDEHRKIRQFGLKKDETLMPIWLVSAICGVGVYAVSML